MGSNTRAQQRRMARAAERHTVPVTPIEPDSDYDTMAGWAATEADLPEARQGLHDMLIDSMGDRRIGPVQWRWWEGDRAVEQLRVLRDGASGALADNYRRIGAHLREYGGFLVVALAEGRRAEHD